MLDISESAVALTVSASPEKVGAGLMVLRDPHAGEDVEAEVVEAD